jgi:hypothetical protein
MAICVVCKTNKVGFFHSHTCYVEGDWHEVCSAKCAAIAEANNQASEQSTPPLLSSDNSATGLPAENNYRLTEKYASQISDLKLFGIKLIIVVIVVGIGFANLEVTSSCSGDLDDPYSISDWDGYCTSSVRFKSGIRYLF